MHEICECCGVRNGPINFWSAGENCGGVGGCGSRRITGNVVSRSSWPQFYQRNNRVSLNVAKGEEQRQRKESMSGQGPAAALERVLCPSEARVMQRANQIVMYVPAHVF